MKSKERPGAPAATAIAGLSAGQLPAPSPEADLSEGDKYRQIWLYLSGGGVRSALGSLGAVFFLTTRWAGEGAWEKVTRISSVSGGSVENTALIKADGYLGAHFWHSFGRYSRHGFWWVIPILGAIAGLGYLIAFVFIFHWPFGARGDWIARAALGLVAVLASLRLLGTLYTLMRMRFLTAPPPRPLALSPLRFENAQRLHTYSAVDVRTSEPAHILHYQGRRAIALDQVASGNVIDFFIPRNLGTVTATFASSSWPLMHYPCIIGLAKRYNPAVRPLPFTPQLHANHSEGKRYRSMLLMDGGLAGTLTGRLDPVMSRSDTAGVMEQIVLPHEDQDIGDNERRRIIVDSGQHGKKSGFAILLPGWGELLSVMVATKVALNSQIELDRSLADGRAPVWVFPVTGGDRHFSFRARSVVLPLTTARATRMRSSLVDRHLILGYDSVDHGYSADEVLVARTIISTLQARADQVGVFKGQGRHGLACAASGVAAGFEEAQGIGNNLTQLQDTLREFETVVLRRGGLDEILGASFANQALIDNGHRVLEETGSFPSRLQLLPPDSHYRWPELERLHGTRPTIHGTPFEPFAISHRGHAPDQRKTNTATAFAAAYDRGCRTFECDVEVSRDGVLFARHGFLGMIRGKRWYQWRHAPSHTYAALERFVADRHDPFLDDDGHPREPKPGEVLARVECLLRQTEDSAADAVTWNFEAKTKRSMTALLEFLNEHRAEGRPLNPPIISGGWRRSKILMARQNNPHELTATGVRGGLSLLFGRPNLHAAVVQLPANWIWPFNIIPQRVANQAFEQRLQVHWYNVNKEKQMRRLHVHPMASRIGISTDNLDDLVEVLGGKPSRSG